MAGPNDSVEASPLPLGRTVVEMPIQGSSGPVKAVNPRMEPPSLRGLSPAQGPLLGGGCGLWVQVRAKVCGCRWERGSVGAGECRWEQWSVGPGCFSDSR